MRRDLHRDVQVAGRTATATRRCPCPAREADLRRRRLAECGPTRSHFASPDRFPRTARTDVAAAGPFHCTRRNCARTPCARARIARRRCPDTDDRSPCSTVVRPLPAHARQFSRRVTVIARWPPDSASSNVTCISICRSAPRCADGCRAPRSVSTSANRSPKRRRVVRSSRREVEALEPAACCAPSARRMTGVIPRSASRIDQRLVRLQDLAESRLRRLVTRIDIRVKPARKTTVSPLDLGLLAPCCTPRTMYKSIESIF